MKGCSAAGISDHEAFGVDIGQHKFDDVVVTGRGYDLEDCGACFVEVSDLFWRQLFKRTATQACASARLAGDAFLSPDFTFMDS